MSLFKLAERCEQAMGPDEALDAAIWLGVKAGENARKAYDEGLKLSKQEAAFRLSYMSDGFRPTASIDAALTLVPEGWFWMVGRRDRNRCRAHVNNGESHFVGMAARPNPAKQWFECLGETPSLALCAAALKARAASVDTHPKDGDVKQAPLVSGAVPEGQTPRGRA